MPTNILLALFTVSFALSAVAFEPSQGFISGDPSSRDGATTNPYVRCLLTRAPNTNCLDGDLSVDIAHTPKLWGCWMQVFSRDGKTLLFGGVLADGPENVPQIIRKKGSIRHFYFSIDRQLIPSSYVIVTFYNKRYQGQMFLLLKTVAILQK